MKKTLDVAALKVESFEALPSAGVIDPNRGTACWELCADDPTSNPDVDTCGAEVCA